MSDLGQFIDDVANELGCEPDNEIVLASIARLRSELEQAKAEAESLLARNVELEEVVNYCRGGAEFHTVRYSRDDWKAREERAEAEAASLRAELAEAVTDSEMMRGEARMLSDKCMQFADQGETLRKRVGELENICKAHTLVNAQQRDYRARAERAEARIAELEKLPHHGILKQKAWLEGECERLEAARRESLALRAAVENQASIDALRTRAEQDEESVTVLREALDVCLRALNGGHLPGNTELGDEAERKARAALAQATDQPSDDTPRQSPSE